MTFIRSFRVLNHFWKKTRIQSDEKGTDEEQEQELEENGPEDERWSYQESKDEIEREDGGSGQTTKKVEGREEYIKEGNGAGTRKVDHKDETNTITKGMEYR